MITSHHMPNTSICSENSTCEMILHMECPLSAEDDQMNLGEEIKDVTGDIVEPNTTDPNS